jgi:2'-5' RNA ligase
VVESVELLLDDDADAAIRAQWTALADAGLPSLASHTGESNRPHVTLAVAESGLADRAAAFAEVFAGWGIDSSGLAVTLGSVQLFPARGHAVVLVRAVVPSADLLTLQDAVTRAARPAQLLATTARGAWTPHVTLARRLPTSQVGPALDVLDAHPLAMRFTAARLWQSETKTVTPLT